MAECVEERVKRLADLVEALMGESYLSIDGRGKSCVLHFLPP